MLCGLVHFLSGIHLRVKLHCLHNMPLAFRNGDLAGTQWPAPAKGLAIRALCATLLHGVVKDYTVAYTGTAHAGPPPAPPAPDSPSAPDSPPAPEAPSFPPVPGVQPAKPA